MSLNPTANEFKLPSKSPSIPVVSLNISTYNILSTYRTVDVKETTQMASKRYEKIIYQIIYSQSDIFFLQEVDKVFSDMLNSFIKTNQLAFTIIGPHLFNKRKDAVGVMILVKLHKCKIVEDLTPICQRNYSDRYPFRGIHLLLDINSILVNVCNIHHYRSKNSQQLDQQLQDVLNASIETMKIKKTLHFPFVVGGDYNYKGDEISSFMNAKIVNFIPPKYYSVPILHNTSYHKYHKEHLDSSVVEIRKSTNTTDQIIYSGELIFNGYNIFPQNGMGDDNQLPYIYPKLKEKKKYEMSELNTFREPNDTVNSDHAMVTTNFLIPLHKKVESRVSGKKKRGSKKKSGRKPRSKRSKKKVKKGKVEKN